MSIVNDRLRFFIAIKWTECISFVIFFSTFACVNLMKHRLNMKLVLFVVITCLFGVFAVGCSDRTPVSRLDEIIDLSSEETVSLELAYDSKGRLTRLGAADIFYEKDKIEIMCSDAILGYGRFYKIVFNLEKGRIVSSESHCLKRIFDKMMELNKINTYKYTDNRIIVDSEFYDFKENRLLKKEREVRELGQDGKMVKVVYSDSEKGGGVALYKYDSNLACNANLNMQAFSYSANGLDDLMVYLLNLIKIPRTNVLPDEVNYTYPSGVIHLYNENCRLDDDRLTKLEVMLNYEILISRLNFKYENSTD